MTWFDIALVTVWSMVAALGWQLGLAGLLWSSGIFVAAAMLALLPQLSLGAAVPAALLLGALLAALLHYARRRSLQAGGAPSPITGAAGLLGGTLLGGLLCAALALAFPLSLRIDASGKHYQYPSSALPITLQHAVGESLLVRSMAPLWEQDSLLTRLLISDREIETLD